MITATQTDTNLSLIMREGKLNNLITKFKYHVYGLRRKNNAAVCIEYDDSYVDENFHKKLKSLLQFFKLNEIDVETESYSGKTSIQIGLRLDLRKILNKNGKPLLATSILSTIVYCIEDRVDIEKMKTHKLSGIPRLLRENDEDDSGTPRVRVGELCEYGWWDATIEEKIKTAMKDDGSTRHDAIIKVFKSI